ncbi:MULTISPECIES: hypothetical protein [unclassified Pseudomonas]|uniref:hypothetical protein n=1 Tax=unclassified Pseudomonas TaxID=196821 RepID=UPI00384D65B8
MIRLAEFPAPKSMLDGLAMYQQTVDANATYAERVVSAKSEFKARNTKTNPIFKQVRAELTRMCSNTRRCCYCEDSMADEVEHIAPKDLYPERVFDWGNYVYACGPCNSPKGNKFAVINASDELIHVGRTKDANVVEPTAGEHALINPRIENPQDFLWLDIIDTFNFVAIDEPGTRSEKRATYTCQLLALNNRDVLIEARRLAFGSYRARLFEYIHRRDAGTPDVQLEALVISLKSMANPAVWAEMKRSHAAHPDIAMLFAKAPEALDW